MTADYDPIQQYGKGKGWNLKSRSVLVEGTTDSDLFNLAAQLHREATGVDLLDSLAIIPAGNGPEGGISGVYRELIRLQGYAGMLLSPVGDPIYRFIGLIDNDYEARKHIRFYKHESNLKEFKDIFRLHPKMPVKGNLDPKTLKKTFEKMNSDWKGLDWELEDLLPSSMFDCFLEDYPTALKKDDNRGGKIHRELTDDGKARFNRFVKDFAELDDLKDVIKTIKALRFYLILD